MGRMCRRLCIFFLVAVSLFAPSVSCKLNKSTEQTCTTEPQHPDQGGPIRWYVNNFGAAQSCAEKLNRSLVIDLWAPWCHTCISVQRTVLNHPSLAPFAEQFVWVTLDTDKPENAAAIRIYPPVAWPTFYVIDPKQGSVLTRFVGAPSLKQFTDILSTTKVISVDSQKSSQTEDLLMTQAHRAEQVGAWTKAEPLYRQALRVAATDWPRRPDVLTSLIRGHVRAGTCLQIMDVIRTESRRIGGSASGTDFANYAHLCLELLPHSTDRMRLLQTLEEQVLSAVNQSRHLSVDDRSDALHLLRKMAITQGKKALAQQFAERQRKLLDQAIRSASSPKLAMAYNWPAAEVYTFLGIPDQLIATLQRSVNQLPDEYDPPYRLAWILLQAHQLDQALILAQKALTLVYGPRKARVYDLIADIEHNRDNREGELNARRGTISVLKNLPEGQQNKAYLKIAQEALAKLTQTTDQAP